MAKIHPRVAWQLVDEEAVLVDLDNGRALGLNETGSFLWSRIESMPEADLARELCSAFEVDQNQARADVASFVGMLRERGLLEP